MTNATLRGKPDAGNPHVRFDEGEVASAKLRRGSLLYKKLMMPVVFFGMLVTAFGETREWKGPANGVWSEPTNWSPEGAPASGDVLKFTDLGAYPSENDKKNFNCVLWFANQTKPVELTGSNIAISAKVTLDGLANCAMCARYVTAPVTIRNYVSKGDTSKIIGSASADYPVTFAGTQAGGFQFGGHLFFDKAVSWDSVWVDQQSPCNAQMHFNAPTNKFKAIYLYNDTKIHCCCAYALSSDKSQQIDLGSNNNRSGTIDIHGFDQSIQKLTSAAAASFNYVVTSDSPAVLRVDAPASQSTSCVVFRGGAGFELNAAESDMTYAFERASSTTGTLAVTKGVLTLNAKWASARTVKVGKDGRLVVALTDGIGAQATATVAEGGVLEVAENCSVTVRKLVLPEIGEVDPGEWGSEESGAEHTSAALSGRGKIYVVAEKSSATWSGDDANDAVSAVSNWRVGGAVPESINVTGGGLLATIAEAGSHATLDRAAHFDGIVFTTPSFEFRNGAYDVLSIGGAGLTAADSATARTLTFKSAVKANADQTWQIGAENSVVLGGGLAGSGAITKTGTGTVTLNANGGATGLFTILGGRGKLIVQTDRVSFPITSQALSDHINPIGINKTSKTVFEKYVKYGGDLVTMAPTGTVEFAGGFWGQMLARPSGAGRLRFTGGNTYIGNTYWDSGSANIGMEFATTNVQTGATSYFMFYNSTSLSQKTLLCSVPWALDYGFNVQLGTSGAKVLENVTLDISGGDQGVDKMLLYEPDLNSTVNRQKVTATGDCLLHVRSVLNADASTHRLYAIFQGGAGLSNESAAEVETEIWANNTSTGRVCVASGTLTFGENGSWANASKLVVTGGRLVLPRKGIVTNRAVDVEISGDGVLELGSGVVLRAHSLKLGDKTYEMGTFGAIGSGASVESAAFAGSGILKLKTGLLRMPLT